jgi:lipoyl(octanoyl) transferase
MPSTSTSRRSSGALLVLDWGRTEYRAALARQHELVADRIAGRVPDTLVLTEHDPVVTLGRGSRPENVLQKSVPIVEVERGGDVTWHGPGQVVGYVVRLLPPERRDLVAHLRGIEDLVIDALARFAIAGARAEGKTGVWVKQADGLRKIASIGIAARSWCTFHGFALNVECDLAAFRAINPCGFDASVMTSLRDLLGCSPGMDAVKAALSAAASESSATRARRPSEAATRGSDRG